MLWRHKYRKKTANHFFKMKKTFFLSLSGLMLALAAPAQHWSLTWKKLQTVSPGLEQIGLVSTGRP